MLNDIEMNNNFTSTGGEMKSLRLFLILLILAMPIMLAAQDELSDEAASALGCGIMIVWLVLAVVWLGLSIWAAIWINKDAKRRGYDKAGLFVTLAIIGIFFGFWWIIWIIYLISRPKNGQGGAAVPAAETPTTPPPPPPPAQQPPSEG